MMAGGASPTKDLSTPPGLSDPSYLHPTIKNVGPPSSMASHSASPAADVRPYFSHSPAESQSPASSANEGATPGPAIRPKPSSATAAQQSSLAPAAVVASPLASGYASPVGSGPIGKAIEVPARPKPGRKTALDEPTSKRKAQNRQAQRNFRQRKLEHAVSLETNNQELRTENQQLLAEVERLQHVVNESQQLETQVKLEMDDLRRRFAENEERWNTSLNAMTAMQEQMRAEKAQQAAWRRQFESKAAEVEALEKKFSAFSHFAGPFSPSTRMPPPSSASPRPQLGQRRTPTPGPLPPKRHSSTDGCGNCGETGECACVDTFIESSHTTKEIGDPLRKASAMSIHSMLSPQAEPGARPRAGSQALPDPMSDVSSEHDILETDFTTLSTNTVIPAVPLSSRPTEAPSAVMQGEDCGFCTDLSNCLCRDTKFDDSTPSGKPSGSLLQSRHATPVSRQPGSCPDCQANPEQKAFCESLARERAANRKGGSPGDTRTTKRPRLESGVTIPCADAFPLFKRLSRSRESVTYETLYGEFMKSHPGSRRDTGVMSGPSDAKDRQFSAFEADIIEVLASLHRANSTSSGSTGSTGIKQDDDATKSSGAHERVER